MDFCCQIQEKAYCLAGAPPAGCTKWVHDLKKQNGTSSSMLRAATELSSLKSIREDASVRRKLPSMKILRKILFYYLEIRIYFSREDEAHL